jgi:hypothetical protein
MRPGFIWFHTLEATKFNKILLNGQSRQADQINQCITDRLNLHQQVLLQPNSRLDKLQTRTQLVLLHVQPAVLFASFTKFTETLRNDIICIYIVTTK